jgi:hypothetical protein
MITEIGIAAGDIWHYLDKKNDALLSEMVQKIGKPREIIMMSIGWLAREGHVTLVQEGKDYRAHLTHR